MRTYDLFIQGRRNKSFAKKALRLAPLDQMPAMSRWGLELQRPTSMKSPNSANKKALCKSAKMNIVFD